MKSYVYEDPKDKSLYSLVAELAVRREMQLRQDRQDFLASLIK
jgi:hypothetical protein